MRHKTLKSTPYQDISTSDRSSQSISPPDYGIALVDQQPSQEEATIQAVFGLPSTQQSAPPPPNQTGMPDQLKTGLESLSGYSMDDVRVHYNSSKPAEVGALAYAQGNQIHLGPGQERHLPHEAWHVVQQKQGRVKPTMQMRGAVNINDDVGLEREADVMGKKVLEKKDGIRPISKVMVLPANNKKIHQLVDHTKGKSRVTEARIKRNANRRAKAKRKQAREAAEAEAWAETVSGWASWAWEKTKSLGLEVMKKVTGGIDPMEVAQTLAGIYSSKANIKTKLIYLAIYGTLEVSNYLKENLAVLIGGDIGEIMELEGDVNDLFEGLVKAWESGEIDEGMVEEEISNQIHAALAGGD